MPDSRRKQIVDKVLARFQGITQANDFKTNLGTNIKVWREADPDFQAEGPWVASIKDIREEPDQQYANVFKRILRFEIIVFTVAEDQTAQEKMRDAFADLEEAIGEDRRWDELAEDTEPGNNEFETYHLGRVVCMGKFEFSIEFETLSFDPYNR